MYYKYLAFAIPLTITGCAEPDGPTTTISIDCPRSEQADGYSIDCGNNGSDNTTIYGDAPAQEAATDLTCKSAGDCAPLIDFCNGSILCETSRCLCNGNNSNFGAPCGSHKAYDANGFCKHYEIGPSCEEGDDCPSELCRDAVCVAGNCIVFVDDDGTVCESMPVATCMDGFCVPFFSPIPGGHKL